MKLSKNLLLFFIPIACFALEFFPSSSATYNRSTHVYPQLGVGVGVLSGFLSNNFSLDFHGNFKTDQISSDPNIDIHFSYYYRLLCFTSSINIRDISSSSAEALPFVGLGFMFGDRFLFRPLVSVSSEKELIAEISVFYVGD